MTQEEKILLLKDLCARLPYEVICDISDENGKDTAILKELSLPFQKDVVVLGDIENPYTIEYRLSANEIGRSVKPYLRPMSSMTKEEKKEFDEVIKSCNNKVFACPEQERRYVFFDAEQEDFMNGHHFDYRGLIPMGLALEAPEGMYKNE